MEFFVVSISNNNQSRSDNLIHTKIQLDRLLKAIDINPNHLDINYQKEKDLNNVKFSKLKALIIQLQRIFNLYSFSKYLEIIFYKRYWNLIKAILKIRNSKKNINKIIGDIYFSNKHELAWRTFLETNFDYLLVFEDDMIIKNDSEQDLQKVKEILEKNLSYEYLNIYIQLANSINFIDLSLEKKIMGKNDGLVVLKGLFTNGSSGYIMSRNLVSILVEELNFSKKNYYIPIDFRIAYIGKKLKKQQIDCISYHFIPDYFISGSSHGYFESTLHNPKINS